MTRPEAVATAQGAATRFAKPFVVYRLPLWPPAVFGVVALDRGLPSEATVVEQLEAFAPPPTPRAGDQGSLF